MKANHLWETEDFSVVVALEPPKGTDLTTLENRAQRLKGRVDAVLVQDSPDAIMRMTPIAACARLNQIGLRPIMGINARDRNRLAIQGDLLGAVSLGINDIFIEEGKDPSYGDHPLTRPVEDVGIKDLAKALEKLTEGQDVNNQKINGECTVSYIAAAEFLDDDAQIEQEFKRIEALVQSGVKAFITSPQFDIELTKKLAERVQGLGAALFVSVMLLKSVGMARYLNEVPGISKVPDSVIEQFSKAEVKPKAGIEIAAGFINKVKEFAKGVVIIPVGWEHKVPLVLEQIGR